MFQSEDYAFTAIIESSNSKEYSFWLNTFILYAISAISVK